MTRHIHIALLLALIALPACDRPGSSTQTLHFYGKVIDQAGVPVSGAEVVVSWSKMVQSDLTGGLGPDESTERRRTVKTAADGTFEVTTSPPFYVLRIESVSKPGYDWVIDWMWHGGEPNPPENRNFQLRHADPGRGLKGNYEPDMQRPAIYPLHQRGNLSPATRPSRGGFRYDYNTGKRIPNEPIELLIPSAGAGAPAPSEIDERIRLQPPRSPTTR